MIKIEFNKEKKTIIINITENNSTEEISNAIVELSKITTELKKDFYIISDLSNFNPDSMEEIVLLNKVNNSLSDKHNIKNVFRVIGDSVSLLQKFARMDKLNHVNNVQYVPTVEQAIAKIEEMK